MNITLWVCNIGDIPVINNETRFDLDKTLNGLCLNGTNITSNNLLYNITTEVELISNIGISNNSTNISSVNTDMFISFNNNNSINTINTIMLDTNALSNTTKSIDMIDTTRNIKNTINTTNITVLDNSTVIRNPTINITTNISQEIDQNITVLDNTIVIKEPPVNITTNISQEIDQNITVLDNTAVIKEPPVNITANISQKSVPNITILDNSTLIREPTNNITTIKNKDTHSIYNISLTNNKTITTNITSPSPKKNLRNRHNPTPSPSKVSNDKSDGNNINNDNSNIYNNISSNITNSTSNIPGLQDNIYGLQYNLAFLHFLWILIPLIVVFMYIYRKKNKKYTKVGCFNFTTNTGLKRCKSMPNLYASVPTAYPPRETVSDSEIDFIII